MGAAAGGTARLRGWSGAIAIAIALACAFNAYSYALLSANPLIQSDVWRYLDGFLGRFIEHGFALRDLFVQEAPSDTNFPLQKLFLFFNTRYFGMDHRLDAMLAVASAMACALVVAWSAAARPWGQWSARECWLLAVASLVVLSLNSTNLYTWPLAGLWFLPVLLAIAYFALVPGAGWRALLVLAFVAGVLLDEFAIPVLAAGLVGGWFGRRLAPGASRAVGATVTGLVLSRLFYWLWHVGVEPAAGGEGIERSFTAFLAPDAWKALAIPLADSVMHRSNLDVVFPASAAAVALFIAVALLAAHGWFWWRVVSVRRLAAPDTAVHVAVALMVLFYALVAGIVLQRVGQFGFDYLHQPRYVLFYQLNLLAIAVLLYRESAGWPGARRRSRLAIAGVVVLVALQAQLAALAWDQTKYVSAYYQQSAHQMGALAADPSASLQCLPIVRVCDFPVEKRQRIMGLLVEHRLNLFSPQFQAFHRLYPGAVPATDIVRREDPAQAPPAAP